MNIKTIKSSAFAFLFLATASWSQSPVLDGYVNEGLQQNLQLKQAKLELEKSQTDLAIARSYFLPQVTASSAYTLANGGRTIEVPVGDLMNPVYQAINHLTATNPIPGDETQFPQIANSKEQFLPNNFHDTKLRIAQPLFNSDIYFGYKAQKELLTVQQAKVKALENEMRLLIRNAYYNYLQSEEVIAIYKSALGLTSELVKLNTTLVANDKVTRDVLLTSQFEASKIEKQLADAEKNRASAEAYFNYLLNRPYNSEIKRDPALAIQVSNPAVDSAIQNSVRNRHEIKQLQGAMRAGEMAKRQAVAAQYLPKVGVGADLGYQGFGYQFNPDQRYALAQFNLSWDLFKGFEKKARTRKAHVDQQILEAQFNQTKQWIELEVVNATNDLTAAQAGLETADAGLKSAERAYQIVHARYREGQALLIELLDAQNKLTSALLSKTISQYEWLKKEAAFQKSISKI